jgi:hypothetical protein
MMSRRRGGGLVGDGPDWRQVDRARLLQVRAEERKKVQEEWASWCEERAKQAVSRIDKDTHPNAALMMGMLSEWLLTKAKELRAPPLAPPLSESKSTAMPETLPTPLAETKTTE